MNVFLPVLSGTVSVLAGKPAAVTYSFKLRYWSRILVGLVLGFLCPVSFPVKVLVAALGFALLSEVQYQIARLRLRRYMVQLTEGVAHPSGWIKWIS